MTEILLYEDIGYWGITAAGVVDQINQAEGGDITLRVNSPGGDVHEGLAIMNALRAHSGTVTAIVEGLAASAASFIVCGGADRAIMRPHAEMMIHDAWTWPDGNADELRRAADALDRLSDNLASIYAAKAGGDQAEWRDRMRAETWYSAEEALAAGLVDQIVDAREQAHQPQLVSARAAKRFKYACRAFAPAPKSTAQGGQEKDTSMDFLNGLAQELGASPETVKNSLQKFVNSEVAVPATVTVSYPDEVSIVPTGKVTIEPTGGAPEGLTVTATAPDGWTVEPVEGTGSVVVYAPEGVSVGDSVEVTISLTGEAGTADVVVTVVVKSAADEPDSTDPASTPAPEGPRVDPVSDMVTMDRATFNELQARAALGDKAYRAEQERAMLATVDRWINEGRTVASNRQRAIEVFRKDPELAEKVYGSAPKNTIPRVEAGYSHSANTLEPGDMSEDRKAAIRKSLNLDH